MSRFVLRPDIEQFDLTRNFEILRFVFISTKRNLIADFERLLEVVRKLRCNNVNDRGFGEYVPISLVEQLKVHQ